MTRLELGRQGRTPLDHLCGTLHTHGVGLAIGVATLLMTACSCGVLMMRPPVRIADYNGDGEIAHLKNAVDPGFKVDFERFSTLRPFSARYRLNGLPTTRWHEPYEVGLVLEFLEEEDAGWPKLPKWLTDGSVGTLALKLEDQTGRILFDAVLDVNSLHWTRFFDDLPFGQPGRTKSHEIPWTVSNAKGHEDRPEPWYLDVKYEPGSDSPDRLARIRFKAGSFE